MFELRETMFELVPVFESTRQLNGRGSSSRFLDIIRFHLTFSPSPPLQTFEIIPMQSNQNKSPVIHAENSLGLESWCIPHVFNYAHKLVLNFKQSTHQYTRGTVQWQQGDVVKYLNVVLLLNPDVTLFWNIRRYLFGHNKLNLTKEFHFSGLVLSKKAKSNEAFAYRRWLFMFLSGESIDYNFEISLCERCADRNASNYHAWSHRMWTLEKDPNLLRYELPSTEKFIRRHISDYSAFHHRSVVLRKLYAQQLFDSGGQLNDLLDLLAVHTGYRPGTTENLVRVLLPVRYSSERDPKHWLRSRSLNTFLRTLNWIAYDLHLMEELTQMFGERETFHCHRKSMLQFLHSLCTEWDKEDETRLTFSPVSKIFRRSTSAEREFGHATGSNGSAAATAVADPLSEDEENVLIRIGNARLFYNLYKSEAARSDRHRNWCRIFLGGFDERNRPEGC